MLPLIYSTASNIRTTTSSFINTIAKACDKHQNTTSSFTQQSIDDMAPTNDLVKRDRCYNSYGSEVYCDGYGSRWNDWGRWAALAGIVIAILIVAFLFSCVNNRRRRRRGAAPMYGTGWVPAPSYKPPTNNQNSYPAPPYSPPVNGQNTGNTFNSNDGYYGQPQHSAPGYGQQSYGGNPYGGQQSGVELQPPQNAYHGGTTRGGENVYEAPYGPPPVKGDGIVR